MFSICSFTSSAQPDPDASAPPETPPATGHAWLPRWVMQLTEIAATLGQRLRRLGEYRAASPTVVPATVDAELGWHLVGRAMRWITALVMRIAAERKAALAATVATERQTGRDAPADPAPRSPRQPAAGARLGRETCIDGKPAAEVIGQICADLTEAAVLLQSPSMARRIAEIAAAARALLGGPGAAWTPLPLIRRGCRVAASTVAAAMADLMGAASPPAAPDTG